MNCDGLKTFFADNTFDVVFTNLLFQWFPEPNRTNSLKLLQEMYRVVRTKGGVCLAEFGNQTSNAETKANVESVGFGNVTVNDKTGWTRSEYLSHKFGEEISLSGKYAHSYASAQAIRGLEPY